MACPVESPVRWVRRAEFNVASLPPSMVAALGGFHKRLLLLARSKAILVRCPYSPCCLCNVRVYSVSVCNVCARVQVFSQRSGVKVRSFCIVDILDEKAPCTHWWDLNYKTFWRIFSKGGESTSERIHGGMQCWKRNIFAQKNSG